MLRHRLFGWSLLALGLVLLASSPAPAAEVSKYLPNDTEVVITVNVKQVLDASLVKQNALDAIRSALKNNDEVQTVLDKLGFDPLRDLNSVTVAVPSLDTDSKKGLLILQGKFDVAKFQAEAARAAQQNGDVLKIHKAGADTIYEVIPPDRDRDPMFVAILGTDTLVASPSRDYVTEALDKKNGKKKPGLDKDLEAMLQKADGKQSLSIVATGTGTKTYIPEAKALAGTINVADDLKAEIRIAGKDPASAKALNKKIIDGKNLLQLIASDNEQAAPVLEILKKLDPKVQGSEVVLSLHVPKDQIEKSIPKKQ